MSEQFSPDLGSQERALESERAEACLHYSEELKAAALDQSEALNETPEGRLRLLCNNAGPRAQSVISRRRSARS